MLTPISIICDPQHKPQKALCFLSLLQKNICISRQSQKQTKGDQGMRGNGWHSNRRVAGFRYQWLGQFIMLKTYICFIYISFVNTSYFFLGGGGHTVVKLYTLNKSSYFSRIKIKRRPRYLIEILWERFYHGPFFSSKRHVLDHVIQP